ncbi:tetratricopeptide repeat protein [uncultured Cohaesibacter sp.]|uniref:tetratricopeptide repeat protein n=1 Tax=uncultured Cohaesibacter sp. TaxID=1002546 RepID=UPI002AAA7CA5|nr:hypothetical protein [uncultured Cohaesibacter sp.]
MDALSIYMDERSSITAFFADKHTKSSVCFVIFSSWSGRALNSKIGGTDPLLREGFDVVCVQTNCDDWHQNIYPIGLEKLKKYLDENYSVVKGYGSSMGGFGAILYAEILNFKSVLALSPQYTISEHFDRRWKYCDNKIVWKYTMDSSCQFDGEIHVFYDPYDLDARHFQLIYNNFKNSKVYGHKVNFGSHPTTYYFNDAGKLKELLVSFAHDRCAIPTIDKRNNITYIKTLAAEAMKRNKKKLAKTLVLKAIDLGDERHSTYRQASNIHSYFGEFDSAVRYALKAVEANDNNAISLSNHMEHLANMLRLTGDLKAALEKIDSVLDQNPDRFTAYIIKANILLAMQNLKKAKSLVLEAIEYGDDRHSTYRLASNLCSRMRDFEGSVVYAKKALEAKDNTDISRISHLEHLANMLGRTGDLDIALEKVDSVLFLAPDRFSAHIIKANILLARQKVEEAKNLVLRAIELGDDRHSTFRQASNICKRLGDTKSSVFFAKKAIEAKNNTEESRKNHTEHLANLLSESGEYNAALRVIEEVLFQDENRSSACLVKANILLGMGALEEDALWLVEKAIFSGDRRPSTYRKASELCRRIDDDEGAEMFAKKAIEAQDNNGERVY